MKKKTYLITIKEDPHGVIDNMKRLLHELDCWGVKKSLYQVEGNTITTKNDNVVDVVTETFCFNINCLDLYKIEVKQ